jgi:D-methionine transport system substrate-binding protein
VRTSVKLTTTALVTGALALSLAACGSGSTSGSASGSAADADKPLIVAASPTPHAQILDFIAKNLAPKVGLKLQVQVVTDYVTPNLAVQDGSADADYFQHLPYLEDFNKTHGTDLVSVEAVHLEPLGLYSNKVKSAKALADGATIAVPNDATNEGRALKLLADNGLITLKSDAGITATPDDIASNPKHFKFQEIDAAQLPRTLSDVDAAVINGNYALDAHLSPTKDALLLEKAQGNPYANILAVKAGNQNDPRVKKLAELLHSPQVKQYIEKTFGGAVIPAF